MQVQNHAYLYKNFNNICINTKYICILCINGELLCKKRGEGNAFTEGRSDYERHWKNEEYEPAFTNWQNMSPSVKKTYTRA